MAEEHEHDGESDSKGLGAATVRRPLCGKHINDTVLWSGFIVQVAPIFKRLYAHPALMLCACIMCVNGGVQEEGKCSLAQTADQPAALTVLHRVWVCYPRWTATSCGRHVLHISYVQNEERYQVETIHIDQLARFVAAFH